MVYGNAWFSNLIFLYLGPVGPLIHIKLKPVITIFLNKILTCKTWLSFILYNFAKMYFYEQL